jgi:molybdate transport system regulatory protein
MNKLGGEFGVRLRIDLGPSRSIGPGKVELLEHIDRSGSLSQAARELGMSYRRAWLLLDDLNHAFAEAVTTASVGGAGGGGARLTAFGRKLIAAYREVEHATDEMAGARLAWLKAQAPAERAISAVSRRPVSRPLTKRSPSRAAPGPAARAAAQPDTRGRSRKRP